MKGRIGVEATHPEFGRMTLSPSGEATQNGEVDQEATVVVRELQRALDRIGDQASLQTIAYVLLGFATRGLQERGATIEDIHELIDRMPEVKVGITVDGHKGGEA